jgi:hypothetical protein
MFDFTDQVFDMVMESDTVKKKVYPVLLATILFNLLILSLLIYITWSITKRGVVFSGPSVVSAT